jgi:hypothetical protein
MKQSLHTPLTDEYLQALEGMKPAEQDHFFYTRLKARMEAVQKTPESFSLKPVLAIAALAIVLLLNTMAIIQQKETKKQPMNNTTSTEYFNKEFDFNTGANY